MQDTVPAPRAPLAELADLVDCLRTGRAVLCAGGDAAAAFADLPFRGFVSAAAGDALERALEAAGRSAAVVKLVGAPRTESSDVRMLVEPLWRRRSLLLVGFDDAALEKLLCCAPRAEGDGPEHWAVLEAGARSAELWASHRIHVLSETDPVRLAHALRAALGDAGGEDELRVLLATLEEDPTRQDILVKLDQLEKRLRWAEEYDALVELYVGRIGVEDDADRRALLLEQLAHLFRFELGDVNRAFSALLERYREVPQREAWQPLGELAAATSRWPELLAVLAESVPDLAARDRVDAWLFVARRRDEQGDLSGAIEDVARALALDDEHPDALALRLDLLRRAGRYAELCEELLSRAEREPSLLERTRLLVEAAEVCDLRLSDASRAAAAYRRALESDPWNEPARHGLEALLRRDGKDAELARFLEEKLGHAPAEEQAAIRRELVELHERLGDIEAAIVHWEALRETAPGDAAILRALERLYERKGSVRELLSILAAQAGIAFDKRERAELYRRMAALWEAEGDRAQAEECLETLLAFEGPSEETFNQLVRLYRADGRWRAAVDALCRHAATCEASERAAIYVQVGEIYEREIGDLARAAEYYLKAESIESGHAGAAEALARVLARGEDVVPSSAEPVFVRALESDPHHVPSMRALAEIYRRRGELLKASQMLARAAEHAALPVDKSRMKLEAAMLLERMEDRSGAIPLYLDAAYADPDHEEAADRASRLLWNAGRYRDMLPILEILIKKEAPPHLQLARLLRLGEAAVKAGMPERALKAWAKALELSPGNPDALRGRAELLYSTDRFEEAHAALTAYETACGAALPSVERADLLHRIATCALRLGREDEARERVEAALQADGGYRPALLTRLELQLGQAEPPMSLVREALELGTDNHRLLHKCLDVCVARKEWTQALRVLDRLVDLEKDPAVRARYREAAGLILHEELDRNAEAADELEAALADDPTLERAAIALGNILRRAEAWPKLANHYYRTLRVLGPDGPHERRLRIWSALADLCLDKLHDREAGRVALESAVHLDPNDVDRRAKLAELLTEAGGEQVPNAIAHHQMVLRADHRRLDSYRALSRLYAGAGQLRRAQACEDALAVLEQRAPAAPGRFLTAKRALDADGWAKLRHPDEDRLLGALFALVGPVIAQAQARPRKDLGLDDEPISPNDDRPFAVLFRMVAATLGVQAPEVHVRRDQMQPLALVIARTRKQPVPALLVGLPLLGDRRGERELTFHLARHVAALRPERIARLLLPQASALSFIIEAAMALGDAQDGTAKPPSSATLASTIESLRTRLTPVALDQVATIGHRLRSRGIQAEAAAAAWLRATDATATRAGLLLCGDLGTLAKLVEADRLADLAFSHVSDEMFAVREQLGLV